MYSTEILIRQDGHSPITQRMSDEGQSKSQCGPGTSTRLWSRLNLGLNPSLPPPAYVTSDKSLNLNYFICQTGRMLIVRICYPQSVLQRLLQRASAAIYTFLLYIYFTVCCAGSSPLHGLLPSCGRTGLLSSRGARLLTAC